MILRSGLRSCRGAAFHSTRQSAPCSANLLSAQVPHLQPSLLPRRQNAISFGRPSTRTSFHTSSYLRYAQPQSADSIMDSLNDLYATAKDEFEIAAEETEKKTVYAADDREAAQEAFSELKRSYEQAVKESDPDTGKEVQGRVGPRIRELGNAITAMEESALED